MKNSINTHRKSIKIAEFDDFDVYVFAPVYKEFIADTMDYFIDENTGENVGQHIELLILPDGTHEESHHSFYNHEKKQIIKFTTADLPYTKAYKKWLEAIKENGEF